MTPPEQLKELRKCARSAAYFIIHFVRIEMQVGGGPLRAEQQRTEWRPFAMWPQQLALLQAVATSPKVAVLKARQLGITWLVLAYALWLMLFRRGSTVMLFSRSDVEAKELLRRLRQMHAHLPEWMQATTGAPDNDHEFTFVNQDSRAKSFPTTKHSGRSFTATLVVIDEADFIQYLSQLLNAAEPAAEAGGQLVLISTSDKEKPNSPFKQIWKAGHAGKNGYAAAFLPWSARPSRTSAWHSEKRAAAVETARLDDFLQEYPATPEEALAGRQGSKRYALAWLQLCKELLPLWEQSERPALPGLKVYVPPAPGRQYVIGADTSEGDLTSDESAATVLDAVTYEEVALLAGRFEPAVFATYLDRLGRWYHHARIAVERNNHGHTVLLRLGDLRYPRLYRSPFDRKLGWLTDKRGKAIMTNHAADIFSGGMCRIRSEATLIQLNDIEAATLAAAEGNHDDLAMSYILALAALQWPSFELPTTHIPAAMSLPATTVR